MKPKLLILLLASVFSISVKAAILTVPAGYSSIQSAINASANGDTIEVAPGSYFENINFRGKTILVTSLYYLGGDTSYISTTIINGSTPASPDSSSCVIFNSGEDSTAILQGFTITGGTGTKWTDIHGAGTYREGGGILIELSSPTIIHNIITNNTATNTAGVVSAGGGGMRIGDGNPTICNNIITHNQGRYGPGIVLNYTGCKISNNIIASNSGGQDYYGGAGIWIYSNLSSTPKIIVNNTIVNNYSSLPSTAGTGGIIVQSASNVIINNNIIWGNLPSTQIKVVSATPSVTYSDIQGGYTGTGNINQDPLFAPQNYFLSNGSPCIDAGDTASVYNDNEDPGNPGFALFPSRGTLTNDMGAYGGPCTGLLPFFQTALGINNPGDLQNEISVYPNPAHDFAEVHFNNPSADDFTLTLFDIAGKNNVVKNNIRDNKLTISKGDLQPGMYLIQLQSSKNIYYSKVIFE